MYYIYHTTQQEMPHHTKSITYYMISWRQGKEQFTFHTTNK